MKKKQYEKPSVEVVELKQEPLMQEVSGKVNNPAPFGYGGDPLDQEP